MYKSIKFKDLIKTNSRLCVASFIASLSTVLFFMMSLILSSISSADVYEYYIGWIIISVVLGYVSFSVGVGLVIVSLVKKKSKNVYVILGLFINLVLFLIFLVTFIISLIE